MMLDASSSALCRFPQALKKHDRLGRRVPALGDGEIQIYAAACPRE
jgi:hypothetical protein